MKTKNRFAAFILAIVMFTLFTFSPAHAENSTGSFPQNQYKSIINYNELQQYVIPNSETPDVFDGHFAGGSINSDGTLTVYVYGTDEELDNILPMYSSVMSYPECVTYEKVDYSLDTLLEFQQDIIPRCSDWEIVTCSVTLSGNCLQIGCKDTSPLWRQRSLIDGSIPYELYVENDGLNLTTAHGGDSISGASIGWCGTYNGSPAILTCAHGNEDCNQLTFTDCDTDDTYTATRVFDTVNDLEEENRLGDYYIATIPSGHTTNLIHGHSAQRIGNGTTYNYTTTMLECSTYLNSVPENTKLHAYGKTSGDTVLVGLVHMSFAYWENQPNGESFMGNSYKGLVGLKVYIDEDIDGDGTADLAQVYPFPAGGDSGGPVYYVADGMDAVFAVGTITGHSTQYFYISPIKYAIARGFSVRTW